MQEVCEMVLKAMFKHARNPDLPKGFSVSLMYQWVLFGVPVCAI